MKGIYYYVYKTPQFYLDKFSYCLLSREFIMMRFIVLLLVFEFVAGEEIDGKLLEIDRKRCESRYMSRPFKNYVMRKEGVW